MYDMYIDEYEGYDQLYVQQMAGQNGAAIKSQLLRAWRERWSDLQWSVNVKKVIPPCYTADSCQLPGVCQMVVFV